MSGGVFHTLLHFDEDPETTVRALRSFFQKWGPAAPLLYVAIVMVEVLVAPIPGAMLYLPGGVIFGGFWGGTLSLIGNTLGAGIACLLTRSIVRRDWTARFFSAEQMSRYEGFLRRYGLVSIVLLRINPLTSSDIVSYAAGLTKMRITTVMAGTLIGMAPLCYLQAYLSFGLLVAFPWLIWPFVIGCIAYGAVAIVIVVRLFGAAK